MRKRPKPLTHEEAVRKALQDRRQREEGTRKALDLKQIGTHLERPSIPVPLDIPASEMHYVVVQGPKSFEWRGWLKALGFRWSQGNMEWVLDRVSEEHAKWIEELVLAWAADFLRCHTGRGLYVERKRRARRRTERW